jgi:regulator of sigma E protease
MSYFLAASGFAALIVLHELGHFLAAKAVGMRVERFFLFFPPKLWGFRRGETEYGIGAIPLGGFVKITGMSDKEDFPPEVAHRAYHNQPVWKRVVTILAGPAMNVLVAFVILFGLAFSVRKDTNDVGKIAAGSPAAAKLRPGDRIVAIDGTRGKPGTLIAKVAAHRCPGKQTAGCAAATPVRIELRRAGRPLTLSIRPTYDPTVKRTKLGFQYGDRPLNPSLAGAASFSGTTMWAVTTRTISTIAHIFDAKDRKQLSSVVGGYAVTREAFTFDVREALGIVAVISLSLALINLFPFLPLDGGHIFWALAEKARGRPIPFSVMERSGAFGFALVIMLFLIGLSNDIGRLTGDGFGIR